MSERLQKCREPHLQSLMNPAQVTDSLPMGPVGGGLQPPDMQANRNDPIPPTLPASHRHVAVVSYMKLLSTTSDHSVSTWPSSVSAVYTDWQ